MTEEYVHQRYPLMPRDKEGKEFKDDVGYVIILRDTDEENAFYADHPNAVKVPEHIEPPSPEEEILSLKARVVELETGNAALKQQQASKTQPVGDEVTGD